MRIAPDDAVDTSGVRAAARHRQGPGLTLSHILHIYTKHCQWGPVVAPTHQHPGYPACVLSLMAGPGPGQGKVTRTRGAWAARAPDQRNHNSREHAGHGCDTQTNYPSLYVVNIIPVC